MSAGRKGPGKRHKPTRTPQQEEKAGGALVGAEPPGEAPELHAPPGLPSVPRTTPYPRDQAIERALTWLAQGRTLRQLCRHDPRMPLEASTVRHWFLEDAGALLPQYASARDMGLEAMVEEVFDIADDGRNDWMDIELGNGKSKRVVDRECVQRSQVRIEFRKWYLAKLAPKRYGDKLDVTSGGEKIQPQSLVLGDVVVVF